MKQRDQTALSDVARAATPPSRRDEAGRTVTESRRPGRRDRGEIVFRRALVIAYLISGAVIAWALVGGWSFYSLPPLLRAHHPGYWTFKAGGSLGHALGIVGSTLMVVMLGYSLRKRVRALRGFGRIGHWLDAHIFMGVVGPLLVILHSSFKVHGLVALSFWSMILVSLSGVVGRFIYLQIPRARNGEALSLAEAEALDRTLAARLRQEFGLDEVALKRLDALSTPPRQSGFWGLWIGLVVDRLRRDRELRDFSLHCPGVPPALLRQLFLVVREKDVLHRRLALWDRVQEVFHHWHILHKPFAVVMYVFMIMHIVVVSLTGYGWHWGLP
jgi:hypothetical protein